MIPIGPRVARPIAVAGLALTAIMTAASLLLSVIVPNAEMSRELDLPVGPLIAIPYAVVGAIIVVRQTGNTVGWLLLAVGLDVAVMFLSGIAEHVASATSAAPVGLISARAIGDVAWVVAFPSIGLILQLFPGGRPLSPRWRIALWLTGTWVMWGTIAVAAVATGAIPRSETPHIFNAVLLLVLVLSVFAILLRARRAQGVERQQIKWLAFGAIPGLLILPAMASQIPAARVAQDVLLMWIPVTIGIAVLRHRLYDIDRLVHRTAVYATVSVLLAAVYGTSVLLLTFLLSQVAEGDALAVAGSTLAAAALFQPVRSIVQRFVDRRFDRAKYDGARTVAHLGTQLRDEVDLDSVLADLQGVITATIGPSSASVWLRPSRGGVKR